MAPAQPWGPEQYAIVAKEIENIILENRLSIHRRPELAPWAGAGSNINKRIRTVLDVMLAQFPAPKGDDAGGDGGEDKKGLVKQSPTSSPRKNKVASSDGIKSPRTPTKRKVKDSATDENADESGQKGEDETDWVKAEGSSGSPRKRSRANED